MLKQYSNYYTVWRSCLCLVMLSFPALLLAQDQLFANALQMNRTTPRRAEVRSLREALEEVQDHFNVSFLYESTVLEGKEVSAKIAIKGKIENTLTNLLEPVGLRFKKINDRTYSILPKTAPKASHDQRGAAASEKDSSADLNPSPAAAEALYAEDTENRLVEIVVQGTITDENSSPIPGANVLVKGTTKGTTTDADGKFSISVPDENAVLVVSFIGYTSEEVPVGSRTTIDVKLTPDIQQLSEVVVVGYGTQKRSSVTGAVATVGSKEVSALPVVSVESAIQGRVPGVQVTSNGSPGTTPTVRIRGIGSITGASQPLYVIDGFPAAGNLNNIDTKDIESVEVLKDAAASAIYGSRAANGVIIITTKSGSRDSKVHVDIDTYYGVQKAWKQLDFLDTNDYLKYGTALLTNAGNALPPRFSAMNDPIYPGATQTYAQTNTDWQGAMFRSAAITQTQVALSVGSDKSKLYTSVSRFHQDGIMIGTNFDRYSYRLNYENKLSNRFTFGENFNISNAATRNQAESGGRTILQHIIHSVPYIPINDPTLLGGYRAPSGNDGSDPENPVRIANMDSNKDNVMNIIGSGYVEAKIFDFLKYKFTAGVNYSERRHKEDLPMYNDGFVSRNQHNLVDNRATIFSPYLSNQLTFDKTFGSHTLNVIAVAEKQNTIVNNLNTSAQQARNDIDQMTGSTNQTISGDKAESTLLSYLARVNYEFKGKYLLSASVRRDGYSGFAPDHKWGNFPGLSVGWRMNEESFMKSIPTISELKLRASYGSLGSIANVGAYDYVSFIQTNTAYDFNNATAPGSYFGKIQNLNLTWEKTKMTNFGVDLGLFENRITFTAEYFVRNVSDLLLDVAPGTSLGYTDATKQNVASMKNWGYEFVAGYTKSNGPITFNISANIGIIRNDVKQLYTSNSVIYSGKNDDFGGFQITRTVAGSSIQEFYGYKTDGIFQNQAEIDAANAVDGNSTTKYQANAAPGDIRFKDINGDGVIDASDQVSLGSYLPKFNYGLNFTANYRNFDLSLFFQGVQGNKIYNGTKVLGQGMLRLFGAEKAVMNAWTPDNTNTDVPRAVNGDPNQNSRTSDRFVEDGSYLRLKNINLGYSIPSTSIQDLTKNTIKKLRIYVSSQNLFTITNYSGYDPEIGNRYQNTSGNTLINGIDYGQFPSPRTFMAGLQIGF
ncbi:MAG TPA: TonB-dependent receptor [Chryseolinea sp.]